MTTSFKIEDILAGLTRQQAIEELLELLQDQGVDTTDWTVGSPSRTMLEEAALVYSALATKAATIASGSFNSLSTGDALTLLSDSFFDNKRQLSRATEGKFVLSASVGIFPLPKTYNPGDLTVTDQAFNYQNTKQILLNASNNVVTTSFRAVQAGADWNIANNSSLSTQTSEVGLSITNPPIAGTNTWITLEGQDGESDNVLRQRNALKWTSLQISGSTADKVKAVTLDASPNLFFVSIDDQAPRGAGTADVWVSRQKTTASLADVELANNALTGIGWNNETNAYVSASAAQKIAFSSSIDVYYSPSVSLTTVREQSFAAADDFIANIPIGGKSFLPFADISNIAPTDDLIDRLRDIDGIKKVIVDPSEDQNLQSNEKLTTPTGGWSTVFTFNKTAL